MAKDRKLQCRKYSTVIGSALILFSSGVYWYWGNMSVYCVSYLHSMVDTDTDTDSDSVTGMSPIIDSSPQVYTPWVISAYLIFWSLGAALSGTVAKILGRRWTVIVGAVVMNVGTLSGYFTVQVSIMSLTLSIGVAMGLGAGLSDSSILQIILEWAEKDAGTLTSMVQGSTCFGGFIINQLVTFYVNPENLAPDVSKGPSKYFSQKEVLDKVPGIFLVIGCLAACLQAVGIVLLHRKPTDLTSLNTDTHLTQIQTKTDKQSLGFQYLKDQTGDGIMSRKETDLLYTRPDKHSALLSDNDCDPIIRKSLDYSPKEMVKTGHFYALWVTSFLGDLSFLMITNYYKIYGQLWIQNDHFLTALGSVLVLANAAVSLLWGLGMDAFGVKKCFIMFMSTSSIIQVWYYFGPMTNKWLYGAQTVLLGCVGGALITCYTAAIALVFGKKHFTTNYGVFMTSVIAMNIMAPSLMEAILMTLGWFELFALIAGCNCIRMIIVFLFVPRI